MTTEAFIALAWQLPAGFTAVPLVHRLLPFRLPVRAIPLFYFLVLLVVLFLPVRIDLALGAAGLLTILHGRLGLELAGAEPPDMAKVRERAGEAVSYLALGYALLAERFPALHLPVRAVRPAHASVEDGGAKDDDVGYQEPPSPPSPASSPVVQRIARL